MGVLTKYFGFLKAEPNENVDVEKHINDTFDSIDNLFHTQSDEIGTKEPKITKNSAFNKNFGTSSGTVLEGKRLAEVLGIQYGGELNNSNSKIAGIAYYDNTTKKTYKCVETTSLNYAESTVFEAISNNDLLEKTDNLSYFRNKQDENGGTIEVTANFNGTLEVESDGLSFYNLTTSLDVNNGNGWVSGVIVIDLSKFSNKMPAKSDSNYSFYIDVTSLFPPLKNISSLTFGNANVYRVNSLTRDLIGDPIEVTWQTDSTIKFYTNDYCYSNSGNIIEDNLESIGISFFLPLFTQEKI